MLVTVNLYSDADFSVEEIKQQILNKDPIIFVVPDYVGDDIFSLVNLSEEYSRYVYVLKNFDISKVFAYLISFNDLDKRNVMIFAPKADLEEVKSFSVNVFNLVTKYTGVKVEQGKKQYTEEHKRNKFNIKRS